VLVEGRVLRIDSRFVVWGSRPPVDRSPRCGVPNVGRVEFRFDSVPVVVGVGVERVLRPRGVNVGVSVDKPRPESVLRGLIVVNRVVEGFERAETPVVDALNGVMFRPKRVGTELESFPGVLLMVSLRSASRCEGSSLNDTFRARAERIADSLEVRVERFNDGMVVLRSARKLVRGTFDSSACARDRALYVLCAESIEAGPRITRVGV
jgi:hypothetical protein